MLTGGSRDDFGSKKYVKAKFKSAEVLSAPVAFTNEVTEKGGKLVGKVSFLHTVAVQQCSAAFRVVLTPPPTPAE